MACWTCPEGTLLYQANPDGLRVHDVRTGQVVLVPYQARLTIVGRTPECTILQTPNGNRILMAEHLYRANRDLKVVISDGPRPS